MTDTKDALRSLGLRRPWNWIQTSPVHISHTHIIDADSPSDAARQIQLEQLAVLHSIRRILFHVAITVPIIAFVVVVVLTLLATF